MFLNSAFFEEYGISAIVEAITGLLLSNSFSFLFAIAAYVLTALSLFTIAQRRGIAHPWLAWIPIADLWILGSISDQYQYVTQGLIRNRRKTLLVLRILVCVLYIVMIALIVWGFVEIATKQELWNVILGDAKLDAATADYLLRSVLPALLGMGGAALVMGILAVIEAVFQYICYYNLFASCQPDNKVLYIVFSILIGITQPIFLMICRNKDQGMPPRRTVEEAPPTIPGEL